MMGKWAIQSPLYVLDELGACQQVMRHLWDQLGELLHVATDGGVVVGRKRLLLQPDKLCDVQGWAGDVGKELWIILWDTES